MKKEKKAEDEKGRKRKAEDPSDLPPPSVPAPALYSWSKTAYARKFEKVCPLLSASALWLGMGICEWGEVEFFNFELPSLAYSSLKGPE